MKQVINVESAGTLGKTHVAKIETVLTKKFGKDCTINYAVNPGLVGGFRVIMGSQMIDLSVREKLEQIKRQLTDDTE